LATGPPHYCKNSIHGFLGIIHFFPTAKGLLGREFFYYKEPNRLRSFGYSVHPLDRCSWDSLFFRYSLLVKKKLKSAIILGIINIVNSQQIKKMIFKKMIYSKKAIFFSIMTVLAGGSSVHGVESNIVDSGNAFLQRRQKESKDNEDNKRANTICQFAYSTTKKIVESAAIRMLEVYLEEPDENSLPSFDYSESFDYSQDFRNRPGLDKPVFQPILNIIDIDGFKNLKNYPSSPKEFCQDNVSQLIKLFKKMQNPKINIDLFSHMSLIRNNEEKKLKEFLEQPYYNIMYSLETAPFGPRRLFEKQLIHFPHNTSLTTLIKNLENLKNQAFFQDGFDKVSLKPSFLVNMKIAEDIYNTMNDFLDQVMFQNAFKRIYDENLESSFKIGHIINILEMLGIPVENLTMPQDNQDGCVFQTNWNHIPNQPQYQCKEPQDQPKKD
jgi:hypothetical protein